MLTDWLIAIAEANDYIVQSTSVPGVAQRTGATLYYLEFFPRAEAERARAASPSWRSCRSPVMSTVSSPRSSPKRAVRLRAAWSAPSAPRSSPRRTAPMRSARRARLGRGVTDWQQLLELVRSSGQTVDSLRHGANGAEQSQCHQCGPARRDQRRWGAALSARAGSPRPYPVERARRRDQSCRVRGCAPAGRERRD